MFRHAPPNYLYLLSALCANFSSPLMAQPPESAIGMVISSRGQVEALDGAGVMRTLSRRSVIYTSDTVITGADGYAQVRLADSALISFKAETEFKFDTYEFDNDAATPDSAVMSMVRGGFLTISGSIGDNDEDEYHVDTPYASIGIRGTTHLALIADGVLYTGVYDGGTTISNNDGFVNLGIGASYDYSETRPEAAPRGLLQEPAALAVFNLTPGLVQSTSPQAGADGNNAVQNPQPQSNLNIASLVTTPIPAPASANLAPGPAGLPRRQ